MRNLVLALCVFALMANVTHAGIVGEWSKYTVGSYDRWVLTVMPTAGEIMTGFDLSVSYSKKLPVVYGGNDMGIFNNNGESMPNGTTSSPTYPAKSLSSGFLLYKKHGTVADMLVVNEGVDSTELYGEFFRTAGGKYASGWSGTLELLQIIVPTGTCQPWSDLVIQGGLNGPGDGFTQFAQISCSNVTGGSERFSLLEPPPYPYPYPPDVPEPSTAILLGCGIFGLLAYAWRKRK